MSELGLFSIIHCSIVNVVTDITYVVGSSYRTNSSTALMLLRKEVFYDMNVTSNTKNNKLTACNVLSKDKNFGWLETDLE